MADSPNLSSVNQLPVAGRPISIETYEHPQWMDGTPILVGQNVRTPDGWLGFVESVAREEIRGLSLVTGMFVLRKVHHDG